MEKGVFWSAVNGTKIPEKGCFKKVLKSTFLRLQKPKTKMRHKCETYQLIIIVVCLCCGLEGLKSLKWVQPSQTWGPENGTKGPKGRSGKFEIN